VEGLKVVFVFLTSPGSWQQQLPKQVGVWWAMLSNRWNKKCLGLLSFSNIFFMPATSLYLDLLSL